MPIDYKKYPPNWKKQIVPAVLARDKHCCAVCGVPNYSMQWRGRKTVEIISIHGRKRKGWATKHYDSKEAAIADGCTWYSMQWLADDGVAQEFIDKREKEDNHDVYQVKIILTIAHLDHDETNFDVKLDRLKAMCQLCHLRNDSAEKYKRSQLKNATDGKTESK